MTGYVDTNTYDITVGIDIVGIKVDNIHRNLKDGVGLNIDMFLAKGQIKHYLKNGNEL